MKAQNTVEYPRPNEIWLACMDGHAVIRGHRPAIVVGTDEEGGLVTVVPLSSKLAYTQKLSHFLVAGQGLDVLSRGLAEHVTTLPRRLLLRRIGYLTDPFDRGALRHALAMHLGLTG